MSRLKHMTFDPREAQLILDALEEKRARSIEELETQDLTVLVEYFKHELA